MWGVHRDLLGRAVVTRDGATIGHVFGFGSRFQALDANKHGFGWFPGEAEALLAVMAQAPVNRRP